VKFLKKKRERERREVKEEEKIEEVS